MKVRAAKPGDAERCVEIGGASSAKEFRRSLRQTDATWLVVENEAGEVVGVGGIHMWQWNKVAWVSDLIVDEKERNKGHGRALLKGMIRAAREMGARVLMDFEPTKETLLSDHYRKNGFRICGTNDRWFAGDKDSTAVFYGYDL